MTQEEKIAFAKSISQTQRALQEECRKALAEVAKLGGKRELAIAMRVYLNSVLAPYFVAVTTMPPEQRPAVLNMLVNDIREVTMNCYEMAMK